MELKNNLRHCKLSPGETLFVPHQVKEIIDPKNILYKDILEEFNLGSYYHPRNPINLGFRENLFAQCPSVLRCIIKTHKSNTAHLPKELLPIKKIIEDILIYDQNINPFYYEMVIHITIDNSIVEKGQTHRYPGFHGDDLQGPNIKPKVMNAHSYLFVNNNPTLYTTQKFNFKLLKVGEDIFKFFDKQVDFNEVKSLRANHLYLIDPYIVHASPTINEAGSRTFFRLSVSPKELLLPNNTKNPMLGI